MGIYLYVLGGLFVLCSIIRVFYPQFIISKKLLARLDDYGTKKEYLINRKVIEALLGIILIIAGYLPEDEKLPICIPLLIIIFIGVLVNNKIYIGSFWGKD